MLLDKHARNLIRSSYRAMKYMLFASLVQFVLMPSICQLRRGWFMKSKMKHP
ncbi:hypothetical protein DITRI_Ditri16bG0047800 [Diplodiscus trichospermus]